MSVQTILIVKIAKIMEEERIMIFTKFVPILSKLKIDFRKIKKLI